MSQYYPQRGPMYPPEHNPEDYDYDEGEYEYEEYDDDEGSGSSLLQPLLAFFAGGCLMFLCMSFCGLFMAALWILDPGAGMSATPIPGSDIGLNFTDPAFPGEAVVNEQSMQLPILDVNRNASLETVQPVEGRELIVVTIELVNLGEADSDFNERDFLLLNAFEEAYQSTPGAVAGALGRGTLPPGEGLEGRLVFEVVAGEIDLVMLWEPGGESQSRYLYLQ